jgi:hypothetical protein
MYAHGELLVAVGRLATYGIDLLAEILGETPEMEKRFPWAVGDPSPKTGRRQKLPFDAVWESRRLIIEIDEPQHGDEVVPFWDKPDVLTVSDVHRGEQRRLYDERKRAAARVRGYLVLEVPWERRPRPDQRDRPSDKRRLIALLREVGVDP